MNRTTFEAARSAVNRIRMTEAGTYGPPTTGPVRMPSLRRALQQTAERGPVPGAGRVTLIGAGRAGVGVSATAAMLAMGVARDLDPLLIFDASNGGRASLAWMFGVPHAQVGERTHLGPGLDLVPAVEPPSDDPSAAGAAIAPAAWRDELWDAASAYQNYQAVMVDVGARLDVVRAALKLGAHQFVAVTNMEPVSVSATYALIKALAMLAPELPIKVIITRAQELDATRVYDHLAEGVEHYLPATNIELAGIVPEDLGLWKGLKAGMTLPEACDGSPAQGALRQIARRLTGLDRPVVTVAQPGPAPRGMPIDTRY